MGVAGEGPRAGEGLRGCHASRQVVRQFSTNRQGCPCRLHPANVTTVGWDWRLVKFIMEDQVLGTVCVAWGRDHPAHAAWGWAWPKCFVWLCSAELASPTVSASWESHIYPQCSLNPLHSFRQVVH